MFDAQEKIAELKTRFNMQVAGAVVCAGITAAGVGIGTGWVVNNLGGEPSSTTFAADKPKRSMFVDVLRGGALVAGFAFFGAAAAGGFAYSASNTKKKIQYTAYRNGLPAPQ